MKNNFKKFIKLVRENPDLEVIPVVGPDVAADGYDWWCGDWGDCRIVEGIYTNDGLYTTEDYYREVLRSVFGAEALAAMDNEEEQRQYEALPWQKTILVYITGRAGGDD